jgi:hypothetical protein
MLGKTDRLLILKKPFEGIEVRQMALALSSKWIMTQYIGTAMEEMVNRLSSQTEAA